MSATKGTVLELLDHTLGNVLGLEPQISPQR